MTADPRGLIERIDRYAANFVQHLVAGPTTMAYLRELHELLQVARSTIEQQAARIAELEQRYENHRLGVDLERAQAAEARAERLEKALRSIIKETPFVPSTTGITAEISFTQIKRAQSALAADGGSHD